MTTKRKLEKAEPKKKVEKPEPQGWCCPFHMHGNNPEMPCGGEY